MSALLSTGESQSLEFKASFDKAAIESLVAFANARGGKVLVGVSDAGKVIGTTVGKETLNEWLGQIKSATSPALIPEIILHDIDGKQIVEIGIQEFPDKLSLRLIFCCSLFLIDYWSAEKRLFDAGCVLLNLSYFIGLSARND